MISIKVTSCSPKPSGSTQIKNWFSEPGSETGLPICTPISVTEVGDDKLGKPKFNFHILVN